MTTLISKDETLLLEVEKSVCHLLANGDTLLIAAPHVIDNVSSWLCKNGTSGVGFDPSDDVRPHQGFTLVRDNAIILNNEGY